MAFDGFFVSSLVNHLQNELTKAALSGGSFVVDKIHQPDPTEVDIYFRLPASAVNLPNRLVLNASAGAARFALSHVKAENPPAAPNFCMLCRKSLEKAHLLSVEQLEGDRIVRFTFETINALGDFEPVCLILEMMGKHSNLILVRADGTIVDALFRVNGRISSVRTVEPGDLYRLAPQKNKMNPLSLLNGRDLEVVLETGAAFAGLDADTRLDKALIASFNGLSPLTAEEIVFRAGLSNLPLYDFNESTPLALAEAMRAFYAHIEEPPAFVLYKNETGEYADFSAFSYGHVTMETEPFDIWKGLDAFYSAKDQKNRIKHRSHDLSQLIKSNIDRMERKISAFHEQLDKTLDLEEDNLKAELLTANIYRLSQGMDKAVVENYYCETGNGTYPTVEIKLNPALSPADNAQAYYKRYNKKKRTQKSLGEQLVLAEDELDYLMTLAYSLEAAEAEADLEGIRKELTATGYIRSRHKTMPPSAPAKILSFKTSDGLEVLIGKNNIQNDQLTFKIAKPFDLWLHVKNRPGSHCILRLADGQNPNVRLDDPDSIVKAFGAQNIKEAAEWAALYSSLSSDDLVEIDYTLQKYVKKPAGAKPGFVIYTHQSSVRVQPRRESR